MGTPDIVDRLETVVAPVLEELGLDLEAVELTRAGKRSVLRVAADKDGGVDMDDIAEATRAVSAALDEADLMGQAGYTLEVSSPGVDRPLTLPRHWRRNRGRLVTVTRDQADPVTGRIVDADEDGAELDTDGGTVRISFAEVRKAKVQIEFKPVGRAGTRDTED